MDRSLYIFCERCPFCSFEDFKIPVPSSYVKKRFFLWMPRKMFGFQFLCDVCKKPLRSKGLYGNVRLVLDGKSYYYLATEYMNCTCGVSFQAWDKRMLDQLPYATKCKFPVALTYKYAVDKLLITILRSRTLGNSTSAFRNNILELHSEEWLQKMTNYLQDCIRHRDGIASMMSSPPTYQPVQEFKAIPTAQWFLSTYARDVMSRMDSLKGTITSAFGEVLKVDSTKKILKKLAGDIRESASWVTNIGNEYGGILQCSDIF